MRQLHLVFRPLYIPHSPCHTPIPFVSGHEQLETNDETSKAYQTATTCLAETISKKEHTEATHISFPIYSSRPSTAMVASLLSCFSSTGPTSL